MQDITHHVESNLAGIFVGLRGIVAVFPEPRSKLTVVSYPRFCAEAVGI